MNMNLPATVTDLVGAVCPISGISFGDAADKATWKIQFSDTATDQQRAAAAGVIAAFDLQSEVDRAIQSVFEQAVQDRLDQAARTRGYDGILSAATYATSKNPRFGPEGIAFRDWRDAVWTYCYQALADVQAGKRAMPTAKDLIAELPPAPVF